MYIYIYISKLIITKFYARPSLAPNHRYKTYFLYSFLICFSADTTLFEYQSSSNLDPNKTIFVKIYILEKVWMRNSNKSLISINQKGRFFQNGAIICKKNSIRYLRDKLATNQIY